MFNSDLKKRMVDVERILASHEIDIQHWAPVICDIQMRLQKVEKTIVLEDNLAAPFGYKITFTFNNPDGSLNGGMCSDIHSVYQIFKLVRKLNGSNLVIKDESIYTNPPK